MIGCPLCGSGNSAYYTGSNSTHPSLMGQVENFDFGPLGIRLNNGIGFALTTGIAHTDTGAVTANAAQFLVSHL